VNQLALFRVREPKPPPPFPRLLRVPLPKDEYRISEVRKFFFISIRAYLAERWWGEMRPLRRTTFRDGEHAAAYLYCAKARFNRIYGNPPGQQEQVELFELL